MSQTLQYTTQHQHQQQQQRPPSQHRTSTSRSPSRPDTSSANPERPPNERSSLSADRLGHPRSYGSTSQIDNGNNTDLTLTNGSAPQQRRGDSPNGGSMNGNESDSGSAGTFTNNGTDRRKGKNKASRELSWFKQWARQFWTLELENKGSVARDHLALERTFLAWLRTSLAFASIGVAVTQLFRLNAAIIPDDKRREADSLQKLGKPLGGCFIGLAILALLCGVHRYYEAQGWLLKGKYPASRGGVLLLSLVALLLVVASLVIVLALGAAQT